MSDGIEVVRADPSMIDALAFYERRGFDVVAELDLPHGAPTTHVMHRRRR
jgi:hypothetical protein